MSRDWHRSPFQAAQEDAIDQRLTDLEKQLEEARKEVKTKRMAAMLHPHKPMSTEQQEELVERLYYAGVDRAKKAGSKRDTATATPVAKQLPRLSTEEQEELNSRLYYGQLERMEEKEEERQQDLTQSLFETSQLEKDELDAFVQRMYDQERDRRSAKAEELRSKYLVESPTKRISRKARDELVKRVYAEAKAKQEQKLQAALDTFLAKPVRGRRLNKAEIASVAERLHRTAK